MTKINHVYPVPVIARHHFFTCIKSQTKHALLSNNYLLSGCVSTCLYYILLTSSLYIQLVHVAVVAAVVVTTKSITMTTKPSSYINSNIISKCRSSIYWGSFLTMSPFIGLFFRNKKLSIFWLLNDILECLLAYP